MFDFLVVLLFIGFAVVLFGFILREDERVNTPQPAPNNLGILKCNIVPPGDAPRRARVEMYADYLLIRTSGPRALPLRVSLVEITDVQHTDESKEGLSMGGLTIVTTQGAYLFHSVGFTAPDKMEKAANIIRRSRCDLTGECLPANKQLRGQLMHSL